MAQPIFLETDPAVITQEIITYFESLTGRTLQPAQVERLVLNTLAYRESLIRAAIQDAAVQNLVEFSRAPYIDYLGDLVGVTRLPASEAACTLEFTLINGHGGVTVPAGTRVQSSDGKVVFVTTQSVNAAIGVYLVSVSAECSESGAVGNGYAIGTVTRLLDPQAFIVSVQNSDITGGGADQEGDDALRERIKLAPSSFTTAGSYGAYKFHAKSANPGISDVAVTSPVPGTVNIYPLMADGSTTPSLVIDQVEEACSADNVRPLTDTVVVLAPTAVNYSLTVNLTLFLGAVGADVQQAVEDALTEWTTSLRQKLGKDVIATQMAQIIQDAAPGKIYNHTLPGWSDQVISPIEFGKCTSITVNITGYTAG